MHTERGAGTWNWINLSIFTLTNGFRFLVCKERERGNFYICIVQQYLHDIYNFVWVCATRNFPQLPPFLLLCRSVGLLHVQSQLVVGLCSNLLSKIINSFQFHYFPIHKLNNFQKGLRARSFEFWLIDRKYQQRLCSLATMTAKIQLFVISIFHQQKSCCDLKAKRFLASDEFQFDYNKVKTHILSFVFLPTSLLYSRKTTTTTSTSVSASGQNRES